MGVHLGGPHFVDTREDDLKSFKSLEGYRLYKSGRVVDIKFHKLESTDYCYFRFKSLPTGRSKTPTNGKPAYEGIVILKNDGSVHGAFCPCLGAFKSLQYTYHKLLLNN